MAACRLARYVSICALFGWSVAAPAIDRIDPRHFDPKTDACINLYQFANGGWLTGTPVPAGLQRNDWLAEQAQTVSSQRRQLLEELSPNSEDVLAATVATLMASVRNEASLPTARQQALAALLPALEQIQRPAHVRELLTSYQQRGLPLLFFARPDNAQTVSIETDLLTLPDPAFYLSESTQGEVWRSRVAQYMSELLRASGSADADTETAWALDFETKLASAMQTRLPLSLSMRELDQRTPGIEWKPLLKALDLDRAKTYRFDDFSAYATVDRLIAEAHPVQWKAWLRFRIAHLLAPYLDSPFRDAHDRLIRGQLLEQSLPITAEQRAEDLTRRLLGAAVDRLYAERFSEEPQRAAVRQLWTALSAALNTSFEQHPDWSEKTRARASEKLAALQLQFAPSGERPDLGNLRLAADNLPGNALALLRWRQQQVERPASSAWLQYRPEQNLMQVDAEALQPPLLDPAAEAAVQFGGLGVLLAHELIHGFDLGGASFDAKGATQAWWSEEERAAFAARLNALEQVQGVTDASAAYRYERAADLAALRLSLAAFRASAAASTDRQHGLSAEQRFFVAWASQLRENALPGQPASEWPNVQRVNAPLPWVNGFASAFQCRKPPAALSPEFWP